MIRLGTARTIITPPKGIYLIGYADRIGGCSSVRDDLTATAAVWESGQGRAAVVCLDMLGLNREVYLRIKSRVSRKLKLNGLFISCSHTHSGPVGWAPERLTPTELIKDAACRLAALPAGLKQPAGLIKNKAYIDSLVEKVSNLILEAALRPEEVEILTGTAPLELGINRREIKDDGTVVIGNNPEGPAPRKLTVIQARQLSDGTPLLNLVNYDCHPVFLGPSSYVVSADWVGEMRRRIETDHPGFCAFLQGGSGNINPDSMDWESDMEVALIRAGESAAEAVNEALKRLQPVFPTERSTSPEQTPMEEAAQEKGVAAHPIEKSVPFITATEIRLDIPLQPGPGYRQALSDFAGMPRWIVDPVLRLRYPWKTEAVEDSKGQMTTPLYCGLLRIGSKPAHEKATTKAPDTTSDPDDGLTFAFLSMETFFETADAVRDILPGKPLFAGYTNGLTGYLPTARAVEEGGYEVEASPYFYRLPGLLDPAAEKELRNAFRKAVNSISLPLSVVLMSDAVDQKVSSIRRARRDDEKAVEHICHQTFFGGPDFPSSSLIAYRWSTWYLRHNPQDSFLAVDQEDRPVGYMLCARDSLFFRDSYKKEMRPLIQGEMENLKRTHPKLYKQYKLEFLPPIDEYRLPLLTKIVREYPAHLHIDLLPEYQKSGLGGKLMNALLDDLKADAVRGIHLIVGGENSNALGYYSRFGFKILASRKFSGEGFHVMGLKL